MLNTLDWESSETHVLLNPRMPDELVKRFHRELPQIGDFAGHCWLTTSGSTAQPDVYTCVALSKSALLSSAKAVNRHLSILASDVWCNPLPIFHVGGLSILARAHLSGSRVVYFTEKWNARAFYECLFQNKVSLTSLVPTQLYDLVCKKLTSPPSLRGVVIGGGHLSESLYEEARALKWPVLPSYGMTEASSQIATACFPVTNQALHILEHMQVKIGEDQSVYLKGDSLLSAYATLSSHGIFLSDPKEEGWFKTQDYGELHGRQLLIRGRTSDFIKIGGESVNLLRLESLLEKLKIQHTSEQPVILLAVPDSRLGHAVHIIIEGKGTTETHAVLDEYQKTVMPFERYRQIHEVACIPRSPLGKVLRPTLLEQLLRSYS